MNSAIRPLTLARAASAAGHPVFYFRGREEIVGIGAAWRSVDPTAALPPGERFMFSIPFDRGRDWESLGPGGVVLPIVTAIKTEHGTQLAGAQGADVRAFIQALPEADSVVEPEGLIVAQVPSAEAWMRLVDQAVAEIASGGISKVVLARRVDVRMEGTRPLDLLEILGDRFPHTYLYGWSDGGQTFLGASPELLVEKRGHTVRSVPLAGSAPRGVDRTEDDAIAGQLLAGAKERREHEFVVDEIARTLRSFTTTLVVPDTPTVVRLPNIQHLGTEIVGTATTDASVIRLAAALHPTPAVAGTPTKDALRLIREFEPFDRGWYAGVIGWADGEGNGESAVALRGALFTNSVAKVYAGAGIVRDSQPQREYAETEAKLDAILEVLVR